MREQARHMTRIENTYPLLDIRFLCHADNLIRLDHCQISQLANTGRHRCIKNGLGLARDLNSSTPGLVRLPDLGSGGFCNFGSISEIKAGLLQTLLKRPAHQRHHPLIALRV